MSRVGGHGVQALIDLAEDFVTSDPCRVWIVSLSKAEFDLAGEPLVVGFGVIGNVLSGSVLDVVRHRSTS